MKKNVARIIAGVISLALAILFKYVACPAMTVRSYGFWSFIFVSSAIFFANFFLAELIGDEDFSEFSEHALTYIAGGATGIIAICIIVLSMVGAKMFNAAEYQKLIAIEEGDFSNDVVAVDNVDNITVVDIETAQKLGDRTIGGMKNATWYEVDDEYNVIIYKGAQYRLSPLNYGGLFKYNKAKYFGIPGYVLVNSITQEAQFVQLEEPIKVSPTAYFGNNLRRVLRNKYSNYQFNTSYFEIDDNGNPYWVTSVVTPTQGVWKAKIATSIIITNATSGESKEYKIDKVPEWVDHVYSLNYLMTLVNYNYSYINGYWNWSKTGVNRTTYSYRSSGSEIKDAFAGYNTAITSSDEVVFYTGVTPANATESNIGFLLASPRTGKVKYYSCAGAEESSAQAAAQGLVQNLGYKATFPTIINVEGMETYFMVLKDGAGLVQRFSLCQVKNYTNVVEAATLEDALAKYKVKVGLETVKTTPEEELKEVSGEISKLYQAQIQGYTYFYFTIGEDTNLYMSSIENGSKQVTLKEGDKITVEYINSSEDGVFTVKSIKF